MKLDDLVDAAQTAGNSSLEMNEVVRRFDRQAIKIAAWLTTKPWLQDDAANEARLAVVRAVNNHAPGTPGFPSFVKRYMKGAALRAVCRSSGMKYMTDLDVAEPSTPATVTTGDTLKRGWRKLNVVKLDEAHTVAADEDDDLGLGLWGGGAVADAVSSLKAEATEMLREIYSGGMSVGDIAADRGVTSSAVSQQLTTAKRTIASALAKAS